jgi:hypothetical protein
MNDRDRAALSLYVRWVADELELRDWTINLSAELPPEGCHALVTSTYGRKLATIKFEDDFRSLDPEQQRHTVVHELVHCHLESATNIVLNDLEEYLGKTADQVFWNGFKRQIEYGVDGIASAIAKHMPLIDWQMVESA